MLTAQMKCSQVLRSSDLEKCSVSDPAAGRCVGPAVNWPLQKCGTVRDFFPCSDVLEPFSSLP